MEEDKRDRKYKNIDVKCIKRKFGRKSDESEKNLSESDCLLFGGNIVDAKCKDKRACRDNL